MSFTDIITVTSSLIAIISAVAAFLGYMSKHIKDKQAIMIVMITSLVQPRGSNAGGGGMIE
jgi:hypothetical protein